MNPALESLVEFAAVSHRPCKRDTSQSRSPSAPTGRAASCWQVATNECSCPWLRYPEADRNAAVDAEHMTPGTFATSGNIDIVATNLGGILIHSSGSRLIARKHRQPIFDRKLQLFESHDLEWPRIGPPLFGAKRFVDAILHLLKSEKGPIHDSTPHVSNQPSKPVRSASSPGTQKFVDQSARCYILSHRVERHRRTRGRSSQLRN